MTNPILSQTTDISPIELRIPEHDPTLSLLKDCLNGEYDPDQKYLICVQGPSTSGKSTFTKTLAYLLLTYGIKIMTVSLDNYYKTTTRDVEDYDFDNPAAFDWESITELFKAIENDDAELPQYSYSFDTWVCERLANIKNPRSSVIIFEGVYAFNIVNRMVFNVDQMDPLDTDKPLEQKYVRSKYEPKFKVLKINLTNCCAKSAIIRIERDIKERGRTEKEAAAQFYKYAWPSTIKWILSDNTPVDMRIVHGTFNEDKCMHVFACITYFFTKKAMTLLKSRFRLDVSFICNGICSKECIPVDSATLVLKDD